MKTWAIIVILAAAIFLLWVMLRSCNALPSHKDGKAAVDSVNAAYALQKAKDLVTIDSLTREDQDKTQRIDDLTVQLLNLKRDLQSRGTAISGTLSNGQHFRSVHDTVEIVLNCDTLAQQVEAGIAIVGGYEHLTDSLITAAKDQARVKDSLSAAYRGLWQRSDAALGVVTGQYNTLYTDYKKANRQLKFNKGLSRILAGAVIAGAVKIFILK